MIVLSLLLVLTSAGLLLAGMIRWLDGASAASTEPLVWSSLAVGALAVLVVALAVARRRGTAAEISDDIADGSADPAREPIGQAGGPGPTAPWLGGPVESAGPGPGEPPDGVVQGPSERGADAGWRPPAHPVPPAPPPDEPTAEMADPADVTVLDRAADARVLVIDGRPRYHVGACPHLLGRNAVEVDRRDARAAGFTPCGLCRPEQQLARGHRP